MPPICTRPMYSKNVSVEDDAQAVGVLSGALIVNVPVPGPAPA